MPTPHMGLTLPVDHNTNDLWGNVLNQAMGLVDAHRHLPGEGRQVPSDGINIDKALPFNGFRATTLGGLSFSSAANPAVNKSLWVADGTGGTTANELYWRNNTGFQVQLTSGTTLNLAFVGGIVDDYASVGALLGYDDGLKRYTFKQGTADLFGFARLHSGPVRISPFAATGGGSYVEHAVNGAIVTPYTVTWPVAVPATTAIAQVDNTGAVSFSNTIVNDVTMTANKSITLSGTGDVKHGARTMQLSTVGAVLMSGVAARNNDGSVTSTASATLGWELPFRTGDRITSLTINGFGDGVIDPLITLRRTTAGTTTDYAAASLTNAPASSVDTTITPGAPSELGADDNLWLQLVCNAGSFTVSRIRVVYDRP
jgi:hypothetical protein